MLKFIKKDACEAKSQYYAKKIMPQVRDLWVGKEVIEMMSVKSVHELFEKDFDAQKYVANMSIEDVKTCCLEIIKCALLLSNAYNDMFNKLLAHFEKYPEVKSHFEAPSLFKKSNKKYVVDFVKSTLEMAEIDCVAIENYKEKIESINSSNLSTELYSYVSRLRETEDFYCDFFAMGVDTVKLEQMALDHARIL